MRTLRWLMLCTALASVGICNTITEQETNGDSSNNTLATAQGIPTSAFTSPAPVGVFNPALSAVTIQGHGGGQDVDFYSFMGMGNIQLSITNNPFTFPTILSLFDSTGSLLAFNDSSTPLKPGSASTDDSYIGTFVLPSFGTYYVSVSNAGASIPNYPDTSSCTDFGSLTRPDGGVGGLSTTGCDSSSSAFGFGGSQPSAGSLGYTLIVAQDESVGQVPEPGTAGLILMGAAGMFVQVLRRRASKTEVR